MPPRGAVVSTLLRGTARASHRRRLERAKSAQLHGLDLQGQIFRVDAALRQTAGNEPEAPLRRPLVHVVELAIGADTPHRADALDHLLAKRAANKLDLRKVARRQHKNVGWHRRS